MKKSFINVAKKVFLLGCGVGISLGLVEGSLIALISNDFNHQFNKAQAKAEQDARTALDQAGLVNIEQQNFEYNNAPFQYDPKIHSYFFYRNHDSVSFRRKTAVSDLCGDEEPAFGGTYRGQTVGAFTDSQTGKTIIVKEDAILDVCVPVGVAAHVKTL